MAEERDYFLEVPRSLRGGKRSTGENVLPMWERNRVIVHETTARRKNVGFARIIRQAPKLRIPDLRIDRQVLARNLAAMLIVKTWALDGG